MPHRVNLILAGAVLLLGLAGASLFRRPASRPDAAGLEGVALSTLTGEMRSGAGNGRSASGAAHAIPPTAIPSYYAPQPDRPNPSVAGPPRAPSILDRLYPPGSPPSRSQPRTPAKADSRGQPANQRPTRRHTIVDGDTLPRLAARYLGDSTRWEDIWQANRGRLSDPEVLPLGMELRIPFAPEAKE